MIAIISVVLILSYTLEVQGQGVACWIKSYGRGIGKIPKAAACGKTKRSLEKRNGPAKPKCCEAGKEKAGGLCYKVCQSGFKGIGPVCWQRACPAAAPVRSGLMCFDSLESKQAFTQKAIRSGFGAVVAAIANPFSLIGNAINEAQQLASVPSCGELANSQGLANVVAAAANGARQLANGITQFAQKSAKNKAAQHGKKAVKKGVR